MRWQNALTKDLLAHLRWSRGGEAPTLKAFKELREFQAELKAKRADMRLYASLCPACDEIEDRLKKAGKL